MTPRPRPSHEKASESENSARFRMMVVDDGSVVKPELTGAFKDNGFTIELVAKADHALRDVRGQRYDAIVINSALAGVDALRLCLALRVQGCLSVVVVVSAAQSTTEQLEAFRAGATDHVEYAMPEGALVERILAHIAGANIKVTGLLYPIIAKLPTNAGVFTMALVPTLITIDDKPLSFTRTEERLFARLWVAQGAVVPDQELIANAWLERRVGLPTLQVHVYQLRRKLGRLGLAIERVAGRVPGYRLSSDAPPNLRKTEMVSRRKS